MHLEREKTPFPHSPDENSATTPYLSDIGILALVPDEWEDTWQVRHQVLSRLAKYFYVAWVGPAQEGRKACHPTEEQLPSAPRMSPVPENLMI